MEVRDRYHRFGIIEFIVDPGAEITTIPLGLARREGLAIPSKSVSCTVHSTLGKQTLLVYPARITVRVPGLPGRDFHWPCHFFDGPDTALLGLSGVLRDLNIHFEDAYTAGAPHGWVILEEHP